MKFGTLFLKATDAPFLKENRFYGQEMTSSLRRLKMALSQEKNSGIFPGNFNWRVFS
jgi:hypothetical protein